jgi:hypothetical protein
MRLLTGILFGLGIVWFALPRLERALGQATEPFEAWPVPDWNKELEVSGRYSIDRLP